MIAFVISSLLGAIVGLVMALTGAGGGVLAVPLLLFGMHQSMAQATPITLFGLALTSTVGALMGLRAGQVRYRAALVIGGSGLVLAPAGVWLSQRLPNAPLTIAFALVMAFSALRMYRGKPVGSEVQRPKAACARDLRTGRFIWNRSCAVIMSSTGMSSGLMSGLLGVGGGFVIVPALTRYTDLAPSAIVNTSLAAIAVVSTAGASAAAISGAMNWGIAAPFGLGAVIAMLSGRMVLQHLSERAIRRAFAALSGCIAVALIVTSLQSLIA